ncbi:MAG: M48 family metallopeptidase [Bacillota bacterium]|nr:M48 family metallopeptidase [Bacillota bacterium]
MRLNFLKRKTPSGKFPYTIKRSRRRTIGIEVTADGVLVRAPQKAGSGEIQRALASAEGWIEERMKRLEGEQQRAVRAGLLSDEDIARLIARAKEYIPGRVAHYAPLIGVEPGRITIRKQKTKWGSCSSKGNLNFNYLLMLAPPEVIDAIVVHELCHLKQMNHSKKFYDEVLRVFPEYRKWNRWLRDNGGVLMQRAGH